MKRIVDGYKLGEIFYSTPIATPSSILPENQKFDVLCRDLLTNIIYSWDGHHYRDASFRQDYTYYNMGKGERIDTNNIYLAKPGQRILGVLNGVDEETCSLTLNLNNTNELTFVVDRIINTDQGAEVSQFYDLISRHYELYLPHHGWFKINEEPELENNGNMETKSVRAESLEIELQQYDLVNFRINMATEDSKEMLATDNTYDIEGYTMFRDQILFYRNVSEYEKFIEEFEQTDQSLQTLQQMVFDNIIMLSSPRLQFNAEGIDDAINSAVAKYQEAGQTEIAERLKKSIGTITEENKEDIKNLAYKYPRLFEFLTLEVNQVNEDDEENEFTLLEVLQREVMRQNELSLMYLILHEHGWRVGYVDPTVIPDSDIEDDRTPLANKVGYFEKDSQDIYSFLTQDVSQYYRCIFVFDTENYLVNCYNINNIGYDTNIYLSFRNIQNEVTRSSDKDLYTVFHVQGAEELDFTEANLGEDWISDISYFLNTDHFSQEFIDKYENWLIVREEKRQEYIQASKDYREKLSIAQELYDRVPIDNADGPQYSTMTLDELLVEKANMEAEKRGYEIPFTDPDTGEIDMEALLESDYGYRYKVLTETVLSSPLDALDYVVFKQGEQPDKYEYGFDNEHSNYKLGNIDIAIFNLRVIDGYYVDPEMSQVEKMKRINIKNQMEYLDNYQYNFEEYGDSYGVAELENKVKVLKNNISALDSTGYNESNGMVYDEQTYDKYQKYTTALAQCEEVLAERKAEYDAAMDDVKNAVKVQNRIKSEANITNPSFEFTTEELDLLDKYHIHTDYVNENILITSQSTNDQIVDTENQLYLDAMEQLFVESHPQYTWTTTQDNLLLMPEFQEWHGDLHVGNFLRVSMRDDFQVKLRVSSITLNPLMIEPTIQLGFTTMTQYRSKRNDYTDLLASTNASTKNQIGSTLSKSKNDSAISVDSDLIMRLLNNSTFASYMGNQVANVSGNAINAVSGSIDSLVAQSINTVDINVGRIVGTQAEFDALWSNYISSNFITTKMLDADNADIRNLTAKIITVGGTQITEDLIQTANLSADQITSGTIDTDRLNATDVVVSGLLSAQAGDFEDLTAQNAFIEYLNSGIIEAGTVSADTVIAALVDAEVGDFDELTAGTAFIDYLNSTLVVASEIQVNDLKAKLAQIDTLTAGSAFVQYLQSISSTAATSVIDDAYISAAVVGKISVGDLTAGDITLSNSMRILSENGQMIMNGQALQIMGEDSNGDPYVGIQLGYDTNENPSLILRNEDGATILTPDGITTDAIADGLIINNMIHDGTIQKGKLGFEIIEPNEQGGIDITQVYDGNGGLFGTEYTSFKNGTQQALQDLAQDIEDNSTYSLYIEAPYGTNIRGGNITLNARLFKNSTEVTSEWGGEYFHWTRHSQDADGDTYWNEAHSTGAKTLIITANEVLISADFQCEFSANGITVSSS